MISKAEQSGDNHKFVLKNTDLNANRMWFIKVYGVSLGVKNSFFLYKCKVLQGKEVSDHKSQVTSHKSEYSERL